MSSFEDTYMYRLATLNVQARTMSRIDVLWKPRSRNSRVATSISSVRRCATRAGFLMVVGIFAVCSELRLLIFRRVALRILKASSPMGAAAVDAVAAHGPAKCGCGRAELEYHDSTFNRHAADRAVSGSSRVSGID